MNVSSRLPLLAATVAVSAALLTGSSRARADLAPQNTVQCRNKAITASCVADDGTDGTCQETMCPGEADIDAGDGGYTIVSAPFACGICVPSGDALLPDGGTTAGSSSSGCSVGSDASASGSLAPVFLLVAFFFLSARSRRANRAV